MKTFYLLLFWLTVFAFTVSGQTYGPYTYSNGAQSISMTMEYVPDLWPGTDAVNIKVTNTSATVLEMKKSILVFNSPMAPTFSNFVSLGALSWPYFTLPPRVIVDDTPNKVYVDSIMYYQNGDTWSNTKLAANASFTCQYYFSGKVGSSFIEQLSPNIKFYPAAWPQPVYFVPVTFNFTGNGGSNATVNVKNMVNNITDHFNINSGASKKLRSNNNFAVWADNFVVGNTQYISQYTQASPYTFQTPATGASTVTLPFSTNSLPTGSFSASVSGLPASAQVTLTLQGVTHGTVKTVQISNGTTPINDLPLDTYNVTAGSYFNSAANIISKATVAASYTLSAATGIALNISYTSCDIIPFAVPGFPKYIAQGGITLGETGGSFTRTPMDVLFKYSGDGGDGDPGKVWDSNPTITYAIKNTIAQCRDLETFYKSSFPFLPSDYKVTPVMVHYTANASGGWSIAAVEMLDTTHLRYHFINLIRETQEFMKNKDAAHPYPGSFIISPDLLGMLQQNYGEINNKPAFDYNNPSRFGSVANGYEANLFTSKIFVNQKLAEAYVWCGLNPASLPAFTDDIKGYFQALTYIVHAVSNNSVTVGYQENMWATGGAQWVTTHTAEPVAMANEVVNFLNTHIGVFNGTYKPDYFVLDRYEMDDFGGGIGNYCYNATAWQRTLTYGDTMAKSYGLPLMLWQFPGGHLVPANGSFPVVKYDQVMHGGAGGTWIFGDKNIGKNIYNVSSTQLSIPLSASAYQGATTVGKLLEADNGYDWGQSQLGSLVNSNVFAILWGGGNTTSITNIAGNGDDDGWLATKVKNYLNGNQAFKTSCGAIPPPPVTGVEKNTVTDSKVEIYPNPATDQLHITIGDTADDLTVEIVSLVGIVLYKNSFDASNSKQINLNISDFPKGLYVVRVHGNAVQKASTIIKQ